MKKEGRIASYTTDYIDLVDKRFIINQYNLW